MPKLSAEQRCALQREADHAAISEGIADLEAGRVLTLEELDATIRSKLGVGSADDVVTVD